MRGNIVSQILRGKVRKMMFFVENSTLCKAIVTPRRLKMWYAYSRREKTWKSIAQRTPTQPGRQMYYAAFANIIELYLNKEFGIFAFVAYIAIIDLPIIRNLQQGGV